MKWQKGQSGNPGGRPKEVGHVRELAREHTEEALLTLAAIMRDPQQPASARAAAANSLLDRGWGKATQAVEHVGQEVVELGSQFTDDELVALLMAHKRQETARLGNGDATR